MNNHGRSRSGPDDEGDDVGLNVEVLIEGEWIRGRVHETRRGETGQETLVSWPVVEGEAVLVREAWVHDRHIRAAVHEGD